ncbi:short-chain dehydrogenase [Ornithinibacillus sp. BX22]|uniref:Short-chain dehydrogenase n=2 Tax=Ornithinibacillus TaxID=484508 RepID=A0A923RFP0_9BACI|nr:MULTISPECIES: short-chain dehydrogenase [Ornithinibacillus]MBC5635556.1 short-chain dehydrogenase [Ornithinibacillus hominis]MBS3679166.1 short-chain dehydrogenase [Ornithinibacillus massiliensis]
MTKNSFAIVIGGTGMLERVCHFLAEEGYDVYVVHRNKNKFQAMQGRCLFPHKLYSISVDYHDEAALQKKIQEAIQLKGGYPDLIVSWIHNSAPHALPTILKVVKERKKPWKLIHVQGSSSFFVKENTTVPDNCEYRRVYLGFVLENRNSRWLTHEEIASGVIKVIKHDYRETVIGTLKPWSKRPS